MIFAIFNVWVTACVYYVFFTFISVILSFLLCRPILHRSPRPRLLASDLQWKPLRLRKNRSA